MITQKPALVLISVCLLLAPSVSSAVIVHGKNPWTLKDIIEVSRIQATATAGSGLTASYILKEPSVAEGKNNYSLFEVDVDHPANPRLLMRAAYLSDLAWQPKSEFWTVRADAGDGVQLYQVGHNGTKKILAENPNLVLIGGADGIEVSPTEEPELTGIVSYGWSSDGKKFWYIKLRERSPAGREQRLDSGIFYDDTRMLGTQQREVDRELDHEGTELHVVDAETGEDAQIKFFPAQPWDSYWFRASQRSAEWVDPGHLQYKLMETSETGELSWHLYRIDVKTGVATRLKADTPEEVVSSVPTEEGYLTVRSNGSEHRLVNVAMNGKVINDYGAVPFPRIGDSFGFRKSLDGKTFVSGVQYRDHDGLLVYPQTAANKTLLKDDSHLANCSFDDALTVGICSRESISNAPELVAIAIGTGQRTTLVRPNARYDSIDPLRVEYEQWKNKYGAENRGYVTYPRDYVQGHSYPAVVVTHSGDAKNKFAYDGFQWEFPIQVFAERGYFVLSVNEPAWNSKDAWPGFSQGEKTTVSRTQFLQGLNPLAGMEAAVEALVKRGDVNPSQVGIAGYSRGASISSLALSLSKVFATGSIGDDNWWSAGGYFTGSTIARATYTSLFGGSPFDPAFWPNYEAFSDSARARYFNGPLLEQTTGYLAKDHLELNELLIAAGVPTELDFYPGESHIFWHPRHRLSAMVRNIDWFDYWLIGLRDSDPAKQDQYRRWDAMRDQQKASQKDSLK